MTLPLTTDERRVLRREAVFSLGADVKINPATLLRLLDQLDATERERDEFRCDVRSRETGTFWGNWDIGD